MILHEDQKPSLEELQHYGVKGMRWGVRRTREQLSVSREARRRSKGEKGTENIKEARRRNVNAPSPYGVMQDQEYFDIRAEEGRRAANKYLKDRPLANAEIKGNPDRVTAARLTAGEKTAVVAITALGGLVMGPIGVVPGVVGAAQIRNDRRKIQSEVRRAQRQLVREGR